MIFGETVVEVHVTSRIEFERSDMNVFDTCDTAIVKVTEYGHLSLDVIVLIVGWG